MVLIHQNSAEKSDLAGLKSEVDKIDIEKLEKVPSGLNNVKSKEADKLDADKLKTIPVDLKQLIDIIKYKVVKKTVYDKLVKKVNAINNSGLARKIDYDNKIED